MNNIDVSELAQAAIAMHEMFTELKANGFTEAQALRLTAYMAMGHPPQ